MKMFASIFALVLGTMCYEADRPPDGDMLFTATLTAGAAFVVLRAFRFKRKGVKSTGSLDAPLLRWNKYDSMTVRDLLSGGVMVYGRPGSGKTSGALRLLLMSVLAIPNSSLLILSSKPEDRGDIERLVAECGRSDDLRIVEPGGALKCNFIEAIGTDARDVTRFLTTVSESLTSGDAGGGQKEQFWQQNIERAIHGAAELCRQAYGAITAPDIQKFIMSAPLSPAQINDPAFRNGFCNTTIAKVFAKSKTKIEQFDFEMYKEQWLVEWPAMADKTRSSILAGVNGILHVLNSGIVRDMVSTETTVSPADLAAGKIIFVDFPIMTYGESARVVLGGYKYITQRWILKRKANPGDSIAGVVCDEAQNLVNSFDFTFASESRSHLGFMIFLSQSVHSYRSAFRGDAGEARVEGLMSAFQTKIVHVLGDHKSAQYFSDLLGQQVEVMSGGSDDPNTTLGDELFGKSGFSSSFNTSYQHIIKPSEFQSGLRTGGEGDGFMVDGFVIHSGRPFVTTKAQWLKVAFRQR